MRHGFTLTQLDFDSEIEYNRYINEEEGETPDDDLEAILDVYFDFARNNFSN